MAKSRKDKRRPRVFISHSSEDAKFAGWLASELEKHEIRVWLDAKDLKVGDSIASRISDALSGMDYFIVVMSKAALESKWVTGELDAALASEFGARGSVVLPVLLADCPIPGLLQGRLYADFRFGRQSGLERLLSVFEQETVDVGSAVAEFESASGSEESSADAGAGERVARAARYLHPLATETLGHLRRLIARKLKPEEIERLWETLVGDAISPTSFLERNQRAIELVSEAKRKGLLDQLCQLVHENIRRRDMRRLLGCAWAAALALAAFIIGDCVVFPEGVSAVTYTLLSGFVALGVSLLSSSLTMYVNLRRGGGRRGCGWPLRTTIFVACMVTVLLSWRTVAPAVFGLWRLDDLLQHDLCAAQETIELGQPEIALKELIVLGEQAKDERLRAIEIQALRLQGDCQRLMWRTGTATKLYDQALVLLADNRVMAHVDIGPLPATAESLLDELQDPVRRRELAHIVRGRAECASLELECLEDAPPVLNAFRAAEALFHGLKPDDPDRKDGDGRAKIGRAELLRSFDQVGDASAALQNVRLSEHASVRLRAYFEVSQGRLALTKSELASVAEWEANDEVIHLADSGQEQHTRAQQEWAQKAASASRESLKAAIEHFTDALRILLQEGPSTDLCALTGRFSDERLDHDLGRWVVIHLTDALLSLGDEERVKCIERIFAGADFSVKYDPVSATYWKMAQARFLAHRHEYGEATSGLERTLDALQNERRYEVAACRTYARGVMTLLDVYRDWAIEEQDIMKNGKTARCCVAQLVSWCDKAQKVLKGVGQWRECDPLRKRLEVYKTAIDEMKARIDQATLPAATRVGSGGGLPAGSSDCAGARQTREAA